MRTATLPGPLLAATGQDTMQAIVQRRYGTVPEDLFRLERIAKPAAGPGEVLVRVRAAGVDRGTWHLMTGLPYLARVVGFGLRAPKLPVPGWAVAGTVEAVGAGVTGLRPGDEVFGTCRGSFAEYVATRASRLAPKPADLTFEQAAALPISATTALQALRDTAKLQPGQRVLVIGASGGVGTFAVQIAKALGAEVTGACRAVVAEIGRAAACSKVRPAGLGARRLARVATYSAKEPRQVPNTSSPGRRPVAPAPTASTVPATAQPGTGNLGARSPKPTTRAR